MKDLKGRSQVLEVSKGKVLAMIAEAHSIEEKRELVLKSLPEENQGQLM